MAGRFVDVTLRLIDRMSSPLKTAGGNLTKSSKQIKRAGEEIKKVGKNIEKAGLSMTKKFTVPIVSAGVACMQLASDFETGMSKVQSIAGATGEEMDRLAEKAKEMGAKTKFSATEATEAFSYMAMAGWDTKAMMDGIEGIMYLAGATGEDLAATSDIVTDALTAFGMKADETQRFVDVLAQTANKSNTNVAMLGESFQYVAPVAGSLGYNVEDVSIALGLMANSGIKASNAGTAMRSWLTNMAKPTKQSQQAMDKLGISLTDSEGNMKDLATMMSETRGAFAKLTEAEKAQYASLLAGKTGMSGLLAIVNSSDEDFNKLSEAMYNSSGACKEMYDVANDNLQGQLTVLKSTVESIAISFGERLVPYVKKAVTWLQGLAEKFNSLSDAQKDTIIKITGIIAAGGPAAMLFGKLTTTVGKTVVAVGKFGKYLPTLTENFGKASQIIKGIDFMPASIRKIGGVFTKLGGKLSILATPFKKLAGNIGALGSRFAFLSGPIQKILSPFKRLYIKIYNLNKGMIGKLLSPFKRLGGIFGGVGKAMFTVLGPGGMVVAILGAIVVAGVLLYKNWDKVKEVAQKVFGFVQNVFTNLGITSESIKEKLAPIGEKFVQIKDKIMEFWTLAQPYVQKFAEIVGAVFGGVVGIAVGGAIGAFENFFGTVISIVGSVMDVFGGLIDFITGVFTGNWSKAWEGVTSIFSGIFGALGAILKAPFNGIIGIFNGVISSINSLGITVPDWVPVIGGQDFKLNIPKIPMLAVGTPDWGGGIAQISEKGGEIVDLPSGSRVYPHDESVKRAFNDGARSGGAGGITIAKLADTIVVREEADIDKIVRKIADKLEKVSKNLGGGELGYIY